MGSFELNARSMPSLACSENIRRGRSPQGVRLQAARCGAAVIQMTAIPHNLKKPGRISHAA